jgi:hypothetical protein
LRLRLRALLGLRRRRDSGAVETRSSLA